MSLLVRLFDPDAGYPAVSRSRNAILRKVGSPNAEIVRRQFEALESAGVEAAARFWHPDIEWRAVEGAVDDVGVLRGKDALRRYYQDWLDMIEDLRGGIEEVVYDSGETLVAVLYNSGRGRGSSIPIRGRYCVVYTVRDGLILRGREYETRQQALEGLELPEDV
jgi:ketosteroid isomerase-like protein